MSNKNALIILSIITFLLTTASFGTEINLIKNGQFDQLKSEQQPLNWQFHVAGQNKDKIALKIIHDPAVPGQTLQLSADPDQLVTDGNWVYQDIAAKSLYKYRLEFSAKAFCQDNNRDHSISVGVAFLADNDKWLGYERLVTLAKHSDQWKNDKLIGADNWQRYVVNFTTLPRTSKLRLRLNFSSSLSGAKSYFADFKLTPPQETTAQVLDRLLLPTDYSATLIPVTANEVTVTPDWSLHDAEVISSDCRTEICLNGLWALAIPDRDGNLPEKIDWSFFKIPGRPGNSRNPFFIYGNKANYKWTDSSFRWLYRSVSLEQIDPDKQYSLRIDSLWNGAAKIFWNNQALGVITDNWGGEVNLPVELINPGHNTLTLLVTGVKNNEKSMHQIWAGNIPDYYDAADSPNVGNVYLVKRPLLNLCDNIRITPSFRNKTLTITASNLGKSNAFYAVTIRDSANKIVLQTLPQQSVNSQLILPWSEPVLWSPEQPDLLYLTLSAHDAEKQVLDQSLPQRFGFRECWTEGKRLIFNGQEIRLRPRNGLYGGGTVLSERFAYQGLSFLKDMGFNTLLRPGNERGDPELIEAADQLGLFVLAYLPTDLADGGQFGDLQIQPVDDALVGWLDAHPIGRFFNNPSVIAYSGFGAMMPISKSLKYANHPAIWGIEPVKDQATIDRLLTENITSDHKVLQRQAAVISFIKAVKQMDISRPFLNHVGTGTGDGWGSYSYFNHLAPQEWEDYPIDWWRRGIQPIGATEHGLPYGQSFVNHGIPDGDNEPWHTEYAAARLGELSYKLERPEFRELISKLYNPQTARFDGSGRHGHTALSYTYKEPVVQEFWARNNARIYRSWRLYSVNMGIEPFGDPHNYVEDSALYAWHNKTIVTGQEFLKKRGRVPDRYLQNDYFGKESFPDYSLQPTGKKPTGLTPLGATLYANNRAFLGFIADKKERPTAKTHIFAAGEKVDKNIALIWDGLSSVNISMEIKVSLGKDLLLQQSQKITLAPNAIQLIPFAFTIPGDSVGSLSQPRSGIITVQFTCNNEKSDDSFIFSVLKPEPELSARIVLYDPENSAGAMQNYADTIIRKKADLSATKADVIIIAPNALQTGLIDSLPPQTPVFVLPQSMEILESLGFRAHPVRERQFWADSSFAVDSELLRDWRAGQLFQSKTDTTPWKDTHNNYIGSIGMVAGVLIETPHFGQFTPLIHGGFDLALTALLLTKIDRRPWLFCQLTLPENVGIDPAAQALTVKLIKDLIASQDNNSAIRSPLERIYLPSMSETQNLVETLGLSVNPDSDWSQNQTADFAARPCIQEQPQIIDRLTLTQVEQVKDYLRQGGRAVIMPQDEEIYQAFGVDYKKTTGALFSDTVFPGLNLGNFHYRQDLAVVTFKNQVMLQQDYGQGKIIWVGFDPRVIDTVKQPYLRLTVQRQYRALSQALTSLGADFAVTHNTLSARLRAIPKQIVLVSDNELIPLRATVSDDSDWLKPDYNLDNWQSFRMGTSNTGLIDAELRVTFDWSEDVSDNWLLNAGTFDDYDIIYLNGVEIGKVTPENSTPETAWKTPRLYPIPAELLQQGQNILAIRTWNRNGLTRNWPAHVRGPLILQQKSGGMPRFYQGKYRASDDPYQLRQW